MNEREEVDVKCVGGEGGRGRAETRARVHCTIHRSAIIY